MSIQIFHLISVFLIISTAESKTKLSDLIPICSLNDPKLNECAKSSAQRMLPILAKGNRDLHLIPLDPLQVPSLNFGQDTGPVSITLKFNNATIHGTSKAIVNSVKLDRNGYKFEGDFTFPKFELIGNYEGKGKILLLPIDGKGIGNITTINMNVHMIFNCKNVTKKGEQYLTIDKLKLTFKYDKAHVVFENLFGGNKELGAVTNRFINENTDEIVNEMRGTLEDVFSELNKKLMNSVFDNIPFREAFKV